jgi:hypothetical protein
MDAAALCIGVACHYGWFALRLVGQGRGRRKSFGSSFWAFAASSSHSLQSLLWEFLSQNFSSFRSVISIVESLVPTVCLVSAVASFSYRDPSGIPHFRTVQFFTRSRSRSWSPVYALQVVLHSARTTPTTTPYTCARILTLAQAGRTATETKVKQPVNHPLLHPSAGTFILLYACHFLISFSLSLPDQLRPFLSLSPPIQLRPCRWKCMISKLDSLQFVTS